MLRDALDKEGPGLGCTSPDRNKTKEIQQHVKTTKKHFSSLLRKIISVCMCFPIRKRLHRCSILSDMFIDWCTLICNE